MGITFAQELQARREQNAEKVRQAESVKAKADIERFTKQSQKENKPQVRKQLPKKPKQTLAELFKKQKNKKLQSQDKGLKAIGVIPAVQTKRQMPPQLKAYLQQKQQAREQTVKGYQQISNLDIDEVHAFYEQEKKRQLLEIQRQQTVLSDSTKMKLQKLLEIQNKSKMADAIKRRQLREMALLGRSMAILNTPSIFQKQDSSMDFTRLPEGTKDILHAKNIFAEDKIRNPSILSKRTNLLDTNSTNNNLRFFDGGLI
jgi:hypothetical protein